MHSNWMHAAWQQCLQICSKLSVQFQQKTKRHD